MYLEKLPVPEYGGDIRYTIGVKRWGFFMVLQTFDILNHKGNFNFNIYMYQLRINFIFVFRSMIFLYGKGGGGRNLMCCYHH